MSELQVVSIGPDELKDMIEAHEALNPDLPIRDDMKDALDRWADSHMLPGGFLRSVLENRLFDAMGRADSYNRATLFQICQYVYNKLPSQCWGSPEKVIKWETEK